jgi:hypothetical protein
MTDNITQLREHPPVNDVPGWLRQTAVDWEAGKFGDRDFLVLIVPAKDEQHWPLVHCLGNNPGQTMINGVLAEAQAFMTIHRVARVTRT